MGTFGGGTGSEMQPKQHLPETGIALPVMV